jgi:hypothetical protein
VHRHAPSGLALGALGIRVVEGARVSGLQLQLRDVAVQQDESLFTEQHAIREAQPLEFALGPASPWTQISDRGRQGLEGLRPLGAKHGKAVFSRSPDFVTRHTKLPGLLRDREQTDPSGDPSHNPILADASAEVEVEVT